MNSQKLYRAFLALLAFMPLFVFGQELRLTIKVKDSFSYQDLNYARVELFEADSATVVYNGKWGTNRILVGNSAQELGLCADVPKRNVYVARISAKNYETRYVRIEIPRKSLSEYIAKDVRLDRADSFYETTLGEATVKASRIAMVVKGDTIEYDARAFRLAEGSMLDKLIAMLPGMKLDEYGQITLNGEMVSCLLVNGRNFFNGDAQVALRNLPAYIVSRVQAYHKAPGWAYLQSEEQRKARRDPLVVDVKLKREYTKGWLANFEAGDGTRTRNAWDNVYLARLFAMNYNDRTDISFYANTNNVGYDQSPTQRGRWQKPDVTQGNKRTRTAGINYNLQVPKHNIDFSSSFKVDNEKTDLQTSTNLVRYVNSSTTAYTGNTSETDLQTQLHYEGRLSAALPKCYMEIRPQVDYTHQNRNSTQNTFETYAADLIQTSADTVRKTLSDYTSLENSLKAQLEFSSTIRGPWSNKNYTLNASAEYKHKTGRNTTNLLTRYPQTAATTLNPYADETPYTSYFYNADLSRQLLRLKLKKNLFTIDASYAYYQNFSSDSRLRREALVEMQTDETALLPSARVEELLVHNAQDSYHTAQLSRDHRIAATFAFLSTPLSASLNLSYTRKHQSYSDWRAFSAVNNNPTYNFFNYYFKLDFKRYKFSLNSATIAPPVYQLLNSTNNSDPTTTYLGNPDLKPENSYRFEFEKSKYSGKHQYFVMAAYDVRRNSIGNELTYDTQTGHRTYQYRNVNGNRYFSLIANYNQPLDKKERFRMSWDANFHAKHSVDFSRTVLDAGNNQRSVVNTYRAGLKTEFSYNNESVICKLKASVSYLRYHSRPYTEGRTNSSFDHTYGFVFIAPVVKNLDLDTDIMLVCRSGYKYAGFNGSDLLWNATLAYSMGRRKQFVLRATAVDLLRQASSVKRFVNLQGYSENRYSTSPSYVLLSLLYRFDVKPAKK